MSKDYYEILGVAPDAAPDELKRAYRALAMKFHPDRNPDNAEAEARFKEITKAYSALSDNQQRAAYDRFGQQAFESGASGGGRGGGGGGAGFGDFSANMSDVFGDIFGSFGGAQGGGQGARHRQTGEDLRYDVEIDLEDVAQGINKEFAFTAQENCETCSGAGAAKGSKIETCSQCGGAGVVHQQSGFFALQRTCGACAGEGQVMTQPCAACSGQGRASGKRTLRVKIPAGINDGAQMRLAGKGNAGVRGTGAGDLYLFVHIKPHKVFDRAERDLYCAVPVSVIDASLGGQVQVPLLDGTSLDVKVPEGSQWGKRLRLRDKGLPSLNSSQTGSLFIDLQVEVPVHLTEEQKNLLQKFGDSLDKSNAPTQEGFVDKIKNFFENLK